MLVFTSDIPSFEYMLNDQREARITNRHIFTQPHTGMWVRTLEYIGDGQVHFETGAGVGESEQRYHMRSYPCWAVPDWIISFDNVMTVWVDDGTTYTVEFSRDLGGSKSPKVLAKNDYILIMTSGRSDDLQNLGGHTDNRAYLQIGNKDNTDVHVEMDITLDTDNTGYIELQKAYADKTTYKYYNGTRTEDFNTGYFELRYEPHGKDAPEIWKSQDNIFLDVWLGPKRTTITPQPTTTTPPPTTVTTPKPITTPPKPTDGPYCKCGVDKFGFPVDWKYNDIWLDV
ncbi:hypothetical protein PENTCL1PPCAC_15310, partial [Pristionchus entomophagus]